MRTWLLTLYLFAGALGAQTTIRFSLLHDLPNPTGVAGPFVGTHGDAMIVAGGANSEGVASQCCVVAGTASLPDAGHPGTSNGKVVRSDVGGINAETPGT